MKRQFLIVPKESISIRPIKPNLAGNDIGINGIPNLESGCITQKAANTPSMAPDCKSFNKVRTIILS